MSIYIVSSVISATIGSQKWQSMLSKDSNRSSLCESGFVHIMVSHLNPIPGGGWSQHFRLPRLPGKVSSPEGAYPSIPVNRWLALAKMEVSLMLTMTNWEILKIEMSMTGGCLPLWLLGSNHATRAIQAFTCLMYISRCRVYTEPIVFI